MANKHKKQDEAPRDKHEVGEPSWKSRKGKTFQDRTLDMGRRERVQEHARRVSWMQNHKPRNSADWLKYR